MVLDNLEKMNIQYNLVDHPPALTTEDADRFIEGIEGVRTKSLFLCNRKSTKYYLLIMDDKKRLDIKKLETLLSDKGIHFCSEEKLFEKMLLPPGIVSLFGLLNNEQKDIIVLLDKEILTERLMSFHVNDNTKTAFISTNDVIRFITDCGFTHSILDL